MSGAVVAILIAIAVEYLRSPKLKLEIEPISTVPLHSANTTYQIESIKVRLFNKKLPLFASWMLREPASQCRAIITFYDLQGKETPGGAMNGRWPNSPQPVPTVVVGPNNQQFAILDQEKLTLVSRIDVFPDESEPLDIAMRVIGQSDCYGWNNESYFSVPQFFNPKWKLPMGGYLVKVVVISSGQKCTKIFHLVNYQTLDLRLATEREIQFVT